MRWLELSVEADVEAVEAVSEILGRVGEGTAVQPTRLIRDPSDELAAREDTSAPYIVTAHIADGPAAAAAIDGTERALWHLQAFGLRPVSPLRVRPVDDADWVDGWRRHYVAQRIGRVVIAPSWAPEEERDGEVVISLDPGMAFGTGLHPTTRGCLELLQELTPMPERALDVGCGSGILALAMARAGLAVTATDNDPQAVATARANAAANGLGDLVTVHEEAGVSGAAVAASAPYGLISANILAEPLIALAPGLAARLALGGRLVLSGLLAPQEPEVTAAYRAVGLSRRDAIRLGDWSTLVLVRES